MNHFDEFSKKMGKAYEEGYKQICTDSDYKVMSSIFRKFNFGRMKKVPDFGSFS